MPYQLLGMVFFVMALNANASETVGDDAFSVLLSDDCATIIHLNERPAFFDSCMKTLVKGIGARALTLPARVKNWGSGGAGGTEWQFENAQCNAMFYLLLEEIHANNPAINLTPHDLFHGHLMAYGEHEQSLSVVVHAKEYPSDLETIKNRYQNPDESFTSTDDSFYDRNFLYLSHVGVTSESASEGLFLLENRGECAKYFDQDSVNTLSENLVVNGLPKGRALGDVNVFLPETLERIKYRFYSSLIGNSDEYVPDYEAIESDKDVVERIWENVLLGDLIHDADGQPIIYFLTGQQIFVAHNAQ